MSNADWRSGPPSGVPDEPGTATTDSGSGREPGSVTEAMRVAAEALRWLANADVASVPVAVQAECLRGLERIASVQTAARATVLSAFDAAAGYENDGSGSPRSWLRWQTQVNGAAATASIKWARRLRAHRAIAAALAAGMVSASWARVICDWTECATRRCCFRMEVKDHHGLVVVAAG